MSSGVDSLRFPIGHYQPPSPISTDTRTAWMKSLAATADKLTEAVSGLSEEQLDTPYREGGWSVRQTVHHIADSHMNSYVRFRLALTEENPTIKPYAEDRWAVLPDARHANVELSLHLIEALHARWVLLLKGISDADWQRTFIHPVSGQQTLENTLGLYAWHGEHHTAQITRLRERMGW